MPGSEQSTSSVCAPLECVNVHVCLYSRGVESYFSFVAYESQCLVYFKKEIAHFPSMRGIDAAPAAKGISIDALLGVVGALSRKGGM